MQLQYFFVILFISILTPKYKASFDFIIRFYTSHFCSCVICLLFLGSCIFCFSYLYDIIHKNDKEYIFPCFKHIFFFFVYFYRLSKYTNCSPLLSIFDLEIMPLILFLFMYIIDHRIVFIQFIFCLSFLVLFITSSSSSAFIHLVEKTASSGRRTGQDGSDNDDDLLYLFSCILFCEA